MKNINVEGKHLVLEGFKNIKTENIPALFNLQKNQAKDCCIQFFDPNYVAGFDHLYFATLNALIAFRNGRNISKDLAVEIMIYASGQRQISKAIKLLGIKPDPLEIIVLVLSETIEKSLDVLDKISQIVQGEKYTEIIELTEKKIQEIMSTFNIKDKELKAVMRKSKKEALTNLIIEHIALLAVQS